MRHGVGTTPEEVEWVAGENNPPPGPERDRNIKTPKTHGRRIDFNRNDA